ncbi:MAG TPA: globin [Pseudogracilibacillus sp.]|nr:globin [Pseudogracilibacillus sp.]
MSIPGTIYEAIGGQESIEKIANNLYKHVAQEPKLMEIFPEDLNESARKQSLFLTQLFGGPQLYLEERGHPMLKRRHLEFEVTHERKELWLKCMNKSLEESHIEEPYRSAIFQRLTMTAEHMVNTLD